MNLIFQGWEDILMDQIQKSSIVKIISPFISYSVIDTIKKNIELNKIILITRFNLNDFYTGVSSIEALELLVKEDAAVFGIKGLHSKVYLFDQCAIITSANLTNGGLKNNLECGVLIYDNEKLNELNIYFNDLIETNNEQLDQVEIDKWKLKLANIEPYTRNKLLSDYGSKKTIKYDKNYFIKILGRSNHRLEKSALVKDVIEGSLCNQITGFSYYPHKFTDGDTFYFSRMVRPNDHIIFGRGVIYNSYGVKANSKQISTLNWLKDYPITVRVKDAKFVNGTLNNGVSLYDMIYQLKESSFRTTLERSRVGETDINPRQSLGQQQYIQLTNESIEYFDKKLNDAFRKYGYISQENLNYLPQI